MTDNTKIKKTPLVIVFDLDETLGSFSQLGLFCSILENYYGKKLDKEEFFKILDENPEYLRPKILDLLQLVLTMKKQKVVDSIMIYTNNQGPKRWASGIADYFSYKLNEPVFDNIIRAFEINGIIIEPNRTSHEKSYSDFLRCTKLPKDTIIYFIDDVKHKQMVDDNVYYVNVKPYHNFLPMALLLNRYNKIKHLSKNEYDDISNIIITTIHQSYVSPNKKPEEEHNIDVLTGKLLITQMNDFFSDYKKKYKYSNNTSLKKYSNKKNKTLKKL